MNIDGLTLCLPSFIGTHAKIMAKLGQIVIQCDEAMRKHRETLLKINGDGIQLAPE